MDSKCQSAFLHSPGDIYQHFFGCLRASEQEDAFARLPEYGRARIREEERRIAQLRAILETRTDIEEGVLLRRHKQALRRWRERAPIKRAKSSSESLPNGHVTKNSGSEENFELEDDLRTTHDLPPPKSTKSKSFFDGSNEEVDVYANMIFFKNSSPHTLSEFLPEEFPNQKISLNRLLYDQDPERNPLIKPCTEDVVRYFHVPANDMKWVEVDISHSLLESH